MFRAAIAYIDVLRSNCRFAGLLRVSAMIPPQATTQISIQSVKLPVRGGGAVAPAASVVTCGALAAGRRIATGSLSGISGVGAASPGRASAGGAATSYSGGAGKGSAAGAAASTGVISTGVEPNGDPCAAPSSRGGGGSSGVSDGVGFGSSMTWGRT